MNCKQTNKKLIFYIEKSLSDLDMQQVKAHINECDSCKQLSVMLESSLKVIDKEKQVEANPFLHTRVLQAIEKRKEQGYFTYQTSFKRVLQPIMYSAILIVGIAFGITLGNVVTQTQYNSLATNDKDELFFNDFDQEPIEQFLLNE